MSAETIAVADHRDDGEPERRVELPVVELLTGRGFVTGKSGSGKSNTASVMIENLLDLGFPVLIVDIEGEYYGLKEKYEILHVGADDECDIQVNEEHAEKVAELALVQNVPIILDISSFLDESEGAALLTAIARQLFVKEKKLKKPFLLVVEEIHEFLPEGGGVDECGKMLIKVSKRGRKHGLGICGISQRPANVKKDFITQCDWLVWHRLTWRNDTRVVKRVLGSEYAEAVEGLAAGEGFLVTDWSESVRRVQFDRKETFDAGATPGLDDFERPDLKSVSSDLVSELEAISEEEQRRQDEIEALRRELQEKERRIEMLESDLADARDLRHMADQFAAALFDHPGRSRMRMRREAQDAEQRTLDETAAYPAETAWGEQEPAQREGDDPDPREGDPQVERDNRATSEAPEPTVDDEAAEAARRDDDTVMGTPSFPAWSDEPPTERTTDERDGADEAGGGTIETAAERVEGDTAEDGGDRKSDTDAERTVVRRVRAELREADPITRRMLVAYREDGPCSPVDAHVTAGGSGDRTRAYSRNATLRAAGLITHVGRGNYRYAVPSLVERAHDGRLSESECRTLVERLERDLLPGGEHADDEQPPVASAD